MRTAAGQVKIDKTPPVGTLSINNGDASTDNGDVVLTLSATDAKSGMGAGAQMQFSNDNSTWSSPEDYAATKSWKLISGLGTKTVYAKFADAVGNWSKAASDTIEVTKLAPKERLYIYLNNKRIAMEETSGNGSTSLTTRKFFYHNDHLGGTNIVTDESGAQVKYLDYKPYGDTKVEEGSLALKKKFTGKELDDSTGLYDYGARMYDAKTGRLITPDPLETLLIQKASISKDALSFRFGNVAEQNILIALLYNPQNLNKYSYCLNNPINYTDPTGLWVAFGEKAVKVLGITVGSHTVIILHPDNPNDFKNDTSTKWHTDSKGGLGTTLSGNPNWKSSLKSPIFGNLEATPGIADDSPSNLKNIQRIQDSGKRSDTQLIKDIINSANKYKNDLPYDPTPCRFDQFYNSNSYTYGVLKDAKISNIRNLPGWQPGADKPIPLKKKE